MPLDISNDQLDRITLRVLKQIIERPDFDVIVAQVILEETGVCSPGITQTAIEFFKIRVGL